MRRVAFIFAHPDDEFGCFESIRLEIESGSEVRCYYLTDGGYGGQPTAVRKQETLGVLRCIGVEASRVHFVGLECDLPDGYLYRFKNMLRAAEVVYGGLSRSGGVDCLYAPAWEGGHQDHDASFVVACRIADSLPSCPPVWQYSLYNGFKRSGVFFNVMRPLRSNGDITAICVPVSLRFKYLRFCLSYRSQWKTWIGLFPFVFVKLLFGGRYRLQLASSTTELTRPHPGALLYERRGMARFDDVLAGALRFVASWPATAGQK